MRLIDADALIEELLGEWWQDCDDKDVAIDVVEHAPTIETEDVNKLQTSAEPSDLISRADTLAKIKEYCIDGDDVVQNWFDTMGIEEVINTMPSLSAEQNIPIGEVSVSDMAGDLISRKKAIYRLLEKRNNTFATCVDDYDRGVMAGLSMATDIVNALPSAETTGALDDAIAKYVADGYMLPPSVDNIPSADRPQGEWVKNNDFIHKAYSCSECGQIVSIKTPFCCECGADMKGDK